MVRPRRAGVPFCLPHKKEPRKVTAEGTGLPWLALRRCEANSHAFGVLRQVPPVAPDAAPSSRPNPLGGSLSKIVALFLEALRNLQLEGVKDHLLFEVRRTEFRGSSPETRILAERTTATDFFAYFFHLRKKVESCDGQVILIFYKILTRNYTFFTFFAALFFRYVQKYLP